MAKSIQQWLDEYGSSHQNKTNKRIHWFCVPQIFWTVMAAIYAIPVLPVMAEVSPHFNWAVVLSVLAILFYVRLSVSLAIGMALFTAVCYAIVLWFEATFPGYLLWFAGIWFVVLWALQFYGHEVEGKKPSFFKDLQFLMIGPAWLMSFIYQKIGLKY
ncbi:MAG: DUF962 domain-containing protein [Gammaproteobacteria bacterium]|nr:DUF962 domain-containing protein [Gammaproteobacteria bacterium]